MNYNSKNMNFFFFWCVCHEPAIIGATCLLESLRCYKFQEMLSRANWACANSKWYLIINFIIYLFLKF